MDTSEPLREKHKENTNDTLYQPHKNNKQQNGTTSQHCTTTNPCPNEPLKGCDWQWDDSTNQEILLQSKVYDWQDCGSVD